MMVRSAREGSRSSPNGRSTWRMTVNITTTSESFRRDRIIDLSYEAARKLGFLARGTAQVEITVVDCEPRLSGS